MLTSELCLEDLSMQCRACCSVDTVGSFDDVFRHFLAQPVSTHVGQPVTPETAKSPRRHQEQHGELCPTVAATTSRETQILRLTFPHSTQIEVKVKLTVVAEKMALQVSTATQVTAGSSKINIFKETKVTISSKVKATSVTLAFPQTPRDVTARATKVRVTAHAQYASGVSGHEALVEGELGSREPRPARVDPELVPWDAGGEAWDAGRDVRRRRRRRRRRRHESGRGETAASGTRGPGSRVQRHHRQNAAREYSLCALVLALFVSTYCASNFMSRCTLFSARVCPEE